MKPAQYLQSTKDRNPHRKKENQWTEFSKLKNGKFGLLKVAEFGSGKSSRKKRSTREKNLEIKKKLAAKRKIIQVGAEKLEIKQENLNPSRRSEEKTVANRNEIDSYNLTVKNLVRKFEPLTAKENLTGENLTTTKVTKIVGKYELMRKSSQDSNKKVTRRCTPSKTPGKLKKSATLQKPSKTPRKLNALVKLFSKKSEIEKVELLESASPLCHVTKSNPLKLQTKSYETKQTKQT